MFSGVWLIPEPVSLLPSSFTGDSPCRFHFSPPLRVIGFLESFPGNHPGIEQRLTGERGKVEAGFIGPVQSLQPRLEALKMAVKQEKVILLREER